MNPERDMKTIIPVFFLVLSAMLSTQAMAEQKVVVGEYEVHYIGLNTAFLSEKVARTYQIKRSKNLGYLSISILKAQEFGAPKPIKASLKGSMSNLLGQTKEIKFRLISEPNAWYHIATFDFDKRDLYRINLTVTPEDTNRTFNAQFKQKFYAD